MAHTFFTIGGVDIHVRQGLLTSTLDLAFRLAARDSKSPADASQFIRYAELAETADDEGGGTMYFPIDELIERGEIKLSEFIQILSNVVDEVQNQGDTIPKEMLAELGTPESLQYDLVSKNVLSFCTEVLSVAST